MQCGEGCKVLAHTFHLRYFVPTPQVELDGKHAGDVYFVPKDVNVESGDKGKDYYDRIRDVIDRIIQRRNLDEARVAELFLSDIEVLEELEELEIVPRRTETRHRTVSGIKFPPRSGYPKPIDVSWKYTGSAYNRKSSRVGEEFNATLIPAAGTFKSVENGQESEELKLYVHCTLVICSILPFQ